MRKFLQLLPEASQQCHCARAVNLAKCLSSSACSHFGTAQAAVQAAVAPPPSEIKNCWRSMVCQQQVRKYAPDAMTRRNAVCWHCNKENAQAQPAMICDACGHLQDVDTSVNYFELLQCPRSYDLPLAELRQRFRQLQALVHPDKFGGKSTREQENSAAWSSLINKAYKTLLTPIERGQYLLALEGLALPESNSALDKEFLMEMMERNEEVQNASTQAELQALAAQLEQLLQKKISLLKSQFDGNALADAQATLVQMKYLQSIMGSIKKKLQGMLDAS